MTLEILQLSVNALSSTIFFFRLYEDIMASASLKNSIYESVWRIKCPSFCAYQQSQLSEVFISVPGQRDPQHMCSAICCVPWFPLTNFFMNSHLKPHSVLMRSTLLVSVQFLLEWVHHQKGNCNVHFGSFLKLQSYGPSVCHFFPYQALLFSSCHPLT